MAKNVYVGNLSFDTTQDRLRELFEAHGQVARVNVITDRYSGRPRGFAFVEMMNDQGANAAIAALNGQQVDGRALKVAPANPRKPRDEGRGRRDNRMW
jgi:RNA recognition motif-containing protein